MVLAKWNLRTNPFYIENRRVSRLLPLFYGGREKMVVGRLWGEDGGEKMVGRRWWEEDGGEKMVRRRWWGEDGGRRW